MRITTRTAYDFVVIQIHNEPEKFPDVPLVMDTLKDIMHEGTDRVAVTLTVKTYPYSKVMSLLIKMSKYVVDHDGILVFIQPDRGFQEALRQTKLDTVLSIVSNESELVRYS